MGRFDIYPLPIRDVEVQASKDDWKYSSKVYEKYETYHGFSKNQNKKIYHKKEIMVVKVIFKWKT